VNVVVEWGSRGNCGAVFLWLFFFEGERAGAVNFSMIFGS
jgi:hypothetical protein